jgi:glutaredoxin-like protein NrdH
MSASFSLLVLSKPACVQCTSTYRSLDKKKLAYDSVDISLPEGADWYAKAKELGYLQAPVVLVLDPAGAIIDHWSGFRPDKLEEYSLKAQAEAPVLELAAA